MKYSSFHDSPRPFPEKRSRKFQLRSEVTITGICCNQEQRVWEELTSIQRFLLLSWKLTSAYMLKISWAHRARSAWSVFWASAVLTLSFKSGSRCCAGEGVPLSSKVAGGLDVCLCRGTMFCFMVVFLFSPICPSNPSATLSSWFVWRIMYCLFESPREGFVRSFLATWRRCERRAGQRPAAKLKPKNGGRMAHRQARAFQNTSKMTLLQFLMNILGSKWIPWISSYRPRVEKA